MVDDDESVLTVSYYPSMPKYGADAPISLSLWERWRAQRDGEGAG